MSFLRPELLGFLALVPLVIIWWERRPKPALRYSDVGLFRNLPCGRTRLARWFSSVVRGLIVLFSILALAGPRLPDRATRLPTEGIAILFACDLSGSMAENDFRWTEQEKISRIAAAQKSFRLFVAGGTTPDGAEFPGRAGDRIGLVSFAAGPKTDCPLTLNHTVLLSEAEKLVPKEVGLDSGTNIGDAIAEGLIRLKAAGDRKRVLIVLSDGEHNATGEGPEAPFQPRQAAQLAANLGIPIYTIDCGGDPKLDSTAEERQQRESGRAVLKTVAEMTGGTAFAANSGVELRAVYAAIDALERQPFVSFQYRRYREFASGCALVAFALLVALVVAEKIVWRRFP